MSDIDDLPSDTDLLTAIGRALAEWSLVEINLCQFFCSIAESKNDRKAVAIFDSIISFEVRISVCDRLMEMEDAPELDKEIWRKLSRRISKAYKKKRHPLAHFSIIYYNIGTVHILPFLTNEKIQTGNVRTISLEEINFSAEHFTDLIWALGWFTDRALARHSRRKKDRERHIEEPRYVAQLRELATLSLQGSRPPPPPSRE